MMRQIYYLHFDSKSYFNKRFAASLKNITHKSTNHPIYHFITTAVCSHIQSLHRYLPLAQIG